MQVIGKVGFGKTFNALQSLDHPAEGDVFKVVALGTSPPTSIASYATRRPDNSIFQIADGKW